METQRQTPAWVALGISGKKRRLAKILYYSVHESLEYDDVSLLQSLGHTVFTLGCYCPISPRENPFRPSLPISAELEVLVEAFRAEGCLAKFGSRDETVLTPGFVALFDAVLVIHDIFFISKYWDILNIRPVIWRSIGQAINDLEPMVRPYRDLGLNIVRWCYREGRAAGYVGHDTVIRAYKDPDGYGPWVGSRETVLTFSNAYKQRYQQELDFFEASTESLTYLVGGGSNGDLKNAIGLVSFSEQRQLLRDCRAYFYCHGNEVPYTLNFIEAWMTGIPVVALHRDAAIPELNLEFNEVNEFVIHGYNGFLVRTIHEARAVLMELLHNPRLATEVGARGREASIQIFGKAKIGDQWKRYLQSLGL